MNRLPYFDRTDAIHERAKAHYHETGALIGAPNGTTRGHYEKYRDMSIDSSLAITNLGLLGLNGLEDLTQRYLCDRNLNTIPLRRFDVLFASYKVYNQRRPTGTVQTACDYTCCLKHILIYGILEMKPEFVEYTQPA